MKIQLLAFISTSCALAAADAPLPAFAGKIEVPELSLSDALKSGQVTPPDAETKAVLAWIRSGVAGSNRYVSRMPVIPPSTEIDKRMPIVKPDSSTDFKIITQKPQIESVK